MLRSMRTALRPHSWQTASAPVADNEIYGDFFSEMNCSVTFKPVPMLLAHQSRKSGMAEFYRLS